MLMMERQACQAEGKNGFKVHEAEAVLACFKNTKRTSATAVLAMGTRAGPNEVRGASRS